MFPAVFLSHGAPTLPLADAPARDFLLGLGKELGRPRAILVASAHWETPAPVLSTMQRNTTIHDFFTASRRSCISSGMSRRARRISHQRLWNC